jgi:phosphatidylserine decarboxylase
MNRWATAIEQHRQAMRIHGGVLPMCAAALMVRLSRIPIPTRRLRLRVFRTIYGKKYPPLEEAESELPLSEYRSFNALFTRGLRPEARPILPAADGFLSPCDGTVQEVGAVSMNRIMTVKGIEYTVDSLLSGPSDNTFEGGAFAIIFLSPSDCHRIFSPQSGHIVGVTHVPGRRLLVHPPFQRKEFPVYSLNERVIVHLRTPLGRCALVLVAGWGVGHITLPLDPNYRVRARRLSRTIYDTPIPIRNGDWIATFELGSTAILITEPGRQLRACVRPTEKIKYGQALFAGSGAIEDYAHE